MRHGKKTKHLSRTAAHRNAMFANMACSLIEHKRINTTTAKAKVLRKYVEPLITKSKADTTHNRRLVFKKLKNKYAVTELFREIAPKVGDRPGGYTRIIKLGNRSGDNAAMAMIELVDYNDTYDLKAGKKKKSTRRSRTRRSGKKDNSSDDAKEAAIKDDAETQNKAEEAEAKKEKGQQKKAKNETAENKNPDKQTNAEEDKGGDE